MHNNRKIFNLFDNDCSGLNNFKLGTLEEKEIDKLFKQSKFNLT